ncbi:MAG TPA: AI-2E family transporter [Candidatus Paceibacterota bacterium]
MKDGKMEISIRSTTLIKIGVFAGIAYLVTQVWSFLLIILCAVVLAAFVESLADGLVKYKIPRGLAIVMVYLIMIVAISGLLYALIPLFASELSGIFALLPNSEEGSSIFQAFGDFINAKEVFSQVSQGGGAAAGSGLADLKSLVSLLSGGILKTISSSLGGIVNAVLLVIISLYLAMQKRSVHKFLKAVTPYEYEPYAISLWARTEKKIGSWFKGQLLSAFIVAVLTAIGLFFLKVPYVILLSAFAAIMGLIPFGIILATIPALIIAFLAGGFELFALTGLLYFVIQQIEGYVIHPLVLNKATGVPSLIIMLSLIVGGKIAGIVGVFLGLPISIMLTEIVNDLEAKKQNKRALFETPVSEEITAE